MKHLYLMRHGQTLFNLQGFVQGRCNSPLTELGLSQARMAGEWLAGANVSFDRICTSPIGRALDTAHAVRAVLARHASGHEFIPEVDPVDGLMERCYGSYEGGPISKVPADVWDPGESLVAAGGEGSEALRARMVDTLSTLMEDDGVRNLLAVTHGSAMLQFKLAWEASAVCEQDQKLGNCCILVFEYDEQAKTFSNIEIVNQ